MIRLGVGLSAIALPLFLAVVSGAQETKYEPEPAVSKTPRKAESLVSLDQLSHRTSLPVEVLVLPESEFIRLTSDAYGVATPSRDSMRLAVELGLLANAPETRGLEVARVDPGSGERISADIVVVALDEALATDTDTAMLSEYYIVATPLRDVVPRGWHARGTSFLGMGAPSLISGIVDCCGRGQDEPPKCETPEPEPDPCGPLTDCGPDWMAPELLAVDLGSRRFRESVVTTSDPRFLDNSMERRADGRLEVSVFALGGR